MNEGAEGIEGAEAIIASSSPASVATGELMVLKNVIKHHVPKSQRAKYIRLANSELGALCQRATASNIARIRELFTRLIDLVKSGSLSQFEYEVNLVRMEYP